MYLPVCSNILIIMSTLRGKWAQGITPKNFMWILADQVAISERPGGIGSAHRKVRREEEIVWLRVNGFTRVISLLESPHNLLAYEEGGLGYLHIPLLRANKLPSSLQVLYMSMDKLTAAREKILVHADGLDDRLIGALGGYLLWSKRLTDTVRVIEVMEHLARIHLTTQGRNIIMVASELASGNMAATPDSGADGVSGAGAVSGENGAQSSDSSSLQTRQSG